MLDSRAATLEKHGRIKEALLDAKALVELAPESHKVGRLALLLLCPLPPPGRC